MSEQEINPCIAFDSGEEIFFLDFASAIEHALASFGTEPVIFTLVPIEEEEQKHE